MGFLLGGPYYFLKGRTGNNVGRVAEYCTTRFPELRSIGIADECSGIAQSKKCDCRHGAKLCYQLF